MYAAVYIFGTVYFISFKFSEIQYSFVSNLLQLCMQLISSVSTLGWEGKGGEWGVEGEREGEGEGRGGEGMWSGGERERGGEMGVEWCGEGGTHLLVELALRSNVAVSPKESDAATEVEGEGTGRQGRGGELCL